MTTFRFEAFSPSGQSVEGVVDANSLPDALWLLRQRGVSPYVAEPAVADKQIVLPRAALSWRSLGVEWQARMFRQLATLLAAGITLDRALQIMASQSIQKAEQALLGRVLNQVSAGSPLSAALADSSKLFKADEVGLIRAGEQSGSVLPVLEELSILLERRLLLRGKLASALIYPTFLMALAPVSLIIIATVLVPNIAPLFEDSGAEMPLILRSMVWASHEIQYNGLYWLVSLIGIFAAICLSLRNPTFQKILGSFLGRLPMIRTIRKRAEASRICRTLGSLLHNGAPLQAALSAVIDVSTKPDTQKKLRSARDAVSGGQKLAAALKLLPSLDANALQLIAIGEETNKLDTMLLYVADNEERALTTYIDRIMVLLIPILTILMGLFVGGIVMSIMKAILSVNDLAIR